MHTLSNIASMADRQKQAKNVSRSDAFQVVLDVIRNPDGVAADVQLAALYAYFLPPVPKTPKTPEQWVALAIGKKDVRYYLNYLYSDGARLIGTDGHRLHIYATDKYAAGFYDTQLNKIDLDAKYPDIDRVIPSSNADTFKLNENPEQSLSHHKGKKIPVVMHGGAWYQKGLLDAALSGLSVTSFKRVAGNLDASILFEDGDRQAVLMPIRHK